ncbi:MAG: PDZ domain-containing protein [Candidatus Cloacimonadota bacterium]|nr:MAG: PDZ domain-containing protein [Candidatus Cloacimonadota bacterium]
MPYQGKNKINRDWKRIEEIKKNCSQRDGPSKVQNFDSNKMVAVLYLLDKLLLLLYIPSMKNIITLTLVFFITLLLNTPINAGEVWGARFPAPSPDGSKISFSYYGDIWVVDAGGGRAERLTVSDGYESKSFWSPNGKWVAFETDRWGNDDICVIPSGGSFPPKRLTYYSTYDALYGWTPDGRYILFGSHRHNLRWSLYKIHLNGELPEQITTFSAGNICFLPEGKKFYYVRGGAAWWRRKYRGGADSDIWLKTLPDGKSERITDSPARDGYPMYSSFDKKLYFLSNRGEELVNNIWRMNPDGSLQEQVTFEEEDIHFPEISWDGRLIVYEAFGCLYTYNVFSDEKKRLNVTITEDYKENPYYFKTFTKDVSEFVLSPDEKEIAFIVHGEIFVMEFKKDNETGKVVRITYTPYLEKHISWHPEKEMLIYSSMKDGDMDIYTIEPETEKRFYDDLVFEIKKTLNTDGTAKKPFFSPDGEKIVYFRNNRELYVMDKNGENSIKLCPDNDVLWIDWSPDSKWLTFSRTTLGWREDIFFVPVDGTKEPLNISNHPNDDYKPMWSADGRRIAFASRNATGDIWMKYVFLHKEDEEKDEEYWKKEEPDSLKEEDITVTIDFEDIEERIHTVTKVSGYYYYVAQSPDGKQFAIYSQTQDKHDIWTVDWRGKELKRVTKNDVHPKQFFVSKDKKKIYYLSGEGRIYNAEIATAKSIPHSFNVEIEIDRAQEKEQVLNEAWWALQDGFYDSDFHEVDWKAMYHKYKDFALHMRTIRGFHSVIAMMIGELNASHLGIWKRGGKRETTGALGIIYDTEYREDGLRVKDIIPDAPASEEKVGIQKGDIITHINGKKIEKGENFYVLLRNKNDKDVMLTLLEDGKKRDVRIKPKDPWSILRLVRKNWIKSNKEFVHKTTNGRIGYLYIASMGGGNLREFKKDLYKEMDKDGLIIDIRYNGGGHIHDELLTILRRTAPYAFSISRDGEKQYSSHFRYDKPTIVIINENCYSDAEIFPAAFKELKLGKLIGMPTFGAVIGTNNITLLDGSGFRVPGTGWYRLGGKSLENIPVEPDIYVENTPEMDGSSTDNQLTRAIEVLLEEIEVGE